MKAPRFLIFLCTVVFLMSLSFAPGEVYAVNFPGPELLGRPTDNSVTVNVVADAALQVYFDYGTSSDYYTDSTTPISYTANEPIKVVIGALTPDTKYYYRMVYRENGGSTWVERDKHSFHTQRSPGKTFTFTVTSDSHVNIMLGSDSLWQQTLSNVANENTDFHLDLGDTFAMDDVTTESGARQAYLFQRSSVFFGRISHSVPIFLAPGNHEEEEGWHLDDTGNPETSKPVLGTNARKRYFPNPIPDDFYTGNTDTYSALDGDHLHEDYYAWTWGDALFVVIDPFWYTTTKPFIGNTGGGETSDTGSDDRWDWTIGDNQYTWLKETLENSNAKYKFLFMHQPTGGTDDYIRGGAAAGTYCEWGGYNEDGTTWGFDARRPGWSEPIHQVLIDNNVSAVFHGHDHQYAYEMRDNIVYQELPSGGFSQSFNQYTTGVGYTIQALPSPGHLRVTIAPSQATVDYVQTSGGGVAYSYTIDPNDSPVIPPCPGDFDSDNDGDVDGSDLAYFISTSGSDLESFVLEFGRDDCDIDVIEEDQEAGFSTIGGSSSSTSNDRCLSFTTGATPMTVSYGYFYGSNTIAGNDLTLAVFEDDSGNVGDQVGGCSNGGDLPTDGVATWHERTWSSNLPSLSASTTYWVCRYTDESVKEYYNTGTSGVSLYNNLSPGACPATTTSLSTRQVTMTVSNYSAH